MLNSVGKHVIVDLFGCNSQLLEKVEFISEVMQEAARKSKATIVGKFFKQFDPYGVSGVVIISESHLSIHTWPEHGLASIDYFSCSDEVDISAAIAYLKNALNAKTKKEIEVRRGSMEIINHVDFLGTTINEMAI
ncbi:MAG: adenosylmethionine decarboxylase [Candidatus Pacebacteria bacterium]|jgi:S-adenosylmethionine decarboxylase|nr:adenosylmethionine decarboxylase [Candidatus Paceibacterota bacterium]